VCNLERSDPLCDTKLVKLLLAAPLVYLLGPYWTLQDSDATISMWDGFGASVSYVGLEAYFMYHFLSDAAY
jgi:hypothetical protein